MTTAPVDTATQRDDRQAAYYAAQSEVLRAIEGLKRAVDGHAVQACGRGYTWGHIGDLTALLAHLRQIGLRTWDNADAAPF